MTYNTLSTIGLLALVTGCSLKHMEQATPEEAEIEAETDEEVAYMMDFAEDEASEPEYSVVQESNAPAKLSAMTVSKDRATKAVAPKSAKKDTAARGAAMSPPPPASFSTAMPHDNDDVPVIDPSSNTEQYTDYGVNRFVQTKQDALSTFSVDVDTASYTIARRKLNSGTLPNYASVRVEEYINFFDYHYDSSKAKPFTVDMEAMPHPFKKESHILRVGLQGKEYTVESRPALHLTFLVDVSGSMSSEDKLPLAKEAMHMLVDTLRDDDSVALATYAGNVSKILAPTYGDNKKAIHAAIDRLNSGGSTAMSSGLDLAYEMAWASFEAGAENRVVVLSDGDANVGNTSWESMLSQIKGYADRGVTMSTIGLGMGNYKDTNMEQLANKGDGNNFYIDSCK
jgi:Ca-activated chloride channel family protein